ncbi:serine hydrolase [Mycobacterium sp. 3519A]|uniref:serine hydrolase domain-containing protein n=1 Tax=Mycobacterium sp. 3519A TaxID=2057184 RepID=UPI0011597B2E|nr:serine hydrolase [Mycobacterium sp. 3519A]
MTQKSAGVMTGFPPPPERRITVANWQHPDNLRWAFRHMREIIPTHLIAARTGSPTLLTKTETEVGSPVVLRLDGSSSSAEEIFADTFTDAILILHQGQVVDERYSAGMTETTRHLVMSVSKSVVGCVAGVLVAQGLLDPQAPVTAYVPEVVESGYGGASVRDLLDMRTGVAFRETYTAADSEVRVMERSMGWAPPLAADPRGGYAYLATVGRDGPHGGTFTYRSADTDMLGWVCERAAGERMADLISTLIWQPMGAEFDAEITCDPVGSAVHDGGISATLRDLGRFAQMILDDGLVEGRQVVPAGWLADAFAPPPGVREAFAHTENEPMLPGGWYRNQFWFFRNEVGPILLCLGIHGQLIFVDRFSRTAIVKLSSWPDAQNPAHLANTLRACGAIAANLSARAATEVNP